MIDAANIITLLLSLAFVIALMGGFAFILKKLNLLSTPNAQAKNKRLKIIEIAALDASRRVALISCDDKEYIVLLGQNNETLIPHVSGGAKDA